MIECIFEKGNKTTSLRHVVMDAIIEKEGKILLVKRAKFMEAEPGKLALPGGFLDKNETTQEGILREVLEETGYQGKIIKLFKIIDTPNRIGDLNRQNVGFVYQLKVNQQIQKPDNESEEIVWLSFKEIEQIKNQIGFDHWELIIDPYIKSRKNNIEISLFN